MKKYKLDLSEYSVNTSIHERNTETQELEIVTKSIPYPLKDNLFQWLRLSGMFKDGVQICDACDLAKQIKNAGDDITLDESEMGLIRIALNKLISQEPDITKGIQALGGDVHEECIRRVFKVEEV